MQNNIFLGLFVGHTIVTLKEVDSTNNYIKQGLSKSKPLAEGTVIMAEKQNAGRGQGHNSWLSQPNKNLTFSILLNPSFLTLNKQFELNKVMSLALNDILRKYFGDTATIKWPNDSYVGENKIGGMLIETIVQGNDFKHAIIGIGLNVNQSNFPLSLRNPTSFNKMLHIKYDLHSLLIEICASVQARYFQLIAGRFSQLNADYQSRLYQLNEWKSYKFEGNVQRAVIRGVSDQGFLQVDTEMGPKEFGLKEIEFINSIAT